LRNEVISMIALFLIATLFIYNISANADLERSNKRNKATEQQLNKMRKLNIDHKNKIEKLEKKLEAKLAIFRAKKKAEKLANGHGVERWRSLVAKYFPANEVNNALITMKYESGGDPNAVSRTQDFGLLQLNFKTWGRFFGKSKQELLEPETNIACARIVFKRAGNKWTPWVGARRAGLI